MFERSHAALLILPFVLLLLGTTAAAQTVPLVRYQNKVVVEIDPYKQTAESDESNNSFEVTIIVEP